MIKFDVWLSIIIFQLQSYANKYYNCYHNATIGCDYKRKSVVVDGLTVNLGIWDTAGKFVFTSCHLTYWFTQQQNNLKFWTGQERFRTIIPHYYRKCHGAVFVYDITDISSFEAVSSWLNDFETNKTDQDCVKMLLGNKADLVPNQRQVLKEKGLEFANANNMLFFEVSAKSRVNLEAAFEELTAEMLTVPLSDEDSSPSHSLSTVTLKEGQSISSRAKRCCPVPL